MVLVYISKVNKNFGPIIYKYDTDLDDIWHYLMVLSSNSLPTVDPSTAGFPAQCQKIYLYTSCWSVVQFSCLLNENVLIAS